MEKKKKEKNENRRTISLLRIVLSVLCIIFAIFIILHVIIIVKNLADNGKPGDVFGYSPVIVNTDTMSGDREDSIEHGALAFIKQIPYQDVNVDDVIIYRVDGVFVIGRAIRSVESDSEICYVIKGDQDVVEYLVLMTSDNFIGVIAGKINGFADLVGFLNSWVGFLHFILIPLIIIIIIIIIELSKLKRYYDQPQREPQIITIIQQVPVDASEVVPMPALEADEIEEAKVYSELADETPEEINEEIPEVIEEEPIIQEQIEEVEESTTEENVTEEVEVEVPVVEEVVVEEPIVVEPNATPIVEETSTLEVVDEPQTQVVPAVVPTKAKKAKSTEVKIHLHRNRYKLMSETPEKPKVKRYNARYQRTSDQVRVPKRDAMLRHFEGRYPRTSDQMKKSRNDTMLRRKDNRNL